MGPVNETRPGVTPLWTPGPARQQASQLRRFLDRHHFDTYETAWEWSVSPATAGTFWRSIAAEFAIRWRAEPRADLRMSGTGVAGATWFEGGALNYAERALQPPATGPGASSTDQSAPATRPGATPTGPGATAVIGRSQTRADVAMTWADLTDLTSRIRAGLLSAGVRAGDRVAAYLPNIPETLAAMLAAASLGAVWTCCAPEMGVTGVLDRLAQVKPVVLLAVDGYRYGARRIDRREQSEAVRAGLPSLTRAVWFSYLDPDASPPAGWSSWADFISSEGPMEFAPVGFDHPLYVLYSSGTTGQPKAIIHRHGGILLEHAKALGLHFDIGPGDRFFWFTTTGWMMWNFCVSGLVAGSAVVTFDGDPSWPAPDALWQVMAETGTTCGGVGAGYLVASMKSGVHPGRDHDLSQLKTLGSTGSPLPAAAAEWVYREVASDVLLASFSGGTDVCTGFVGGSPLHPVWAGEISCRCLGASVEVFDDEGQPVVDQEGELVLTEPLPSMPVGFWADPDGSRYRAAYFERFPGVWAHGDRALLTDRGTCIVTGRSDGTLNRGGVRMGTAEFYSVVETFDEIADSLIVHLEDPGGGPGELWLFLVTVGDPLPDLEDRLRAALRRDLSPRYVPDRIEVVAEIPRTLSGKRLEVPVKRILNGVSPDEALTLASVANPDSLGPFATLASSRSDNTRSGQEGQGQPAQT